MIYLISLTGVATTNNEAGAGMLETIGFHRCSQEKYQQMLQRIRREDAKAAKPQERKEVRNNE